MGIATGLFEKGCTVVRTLLSVSVKVETPSVFGRVYIALWVGNSLGIPSDITAQSDESYMLWTGWSQTFADATAEGSTERYVYRNFDLRGQRIARSDSDGLMLIVGAVNSQFTCDAYSRVLCLLP